MEGGVCTGLFTLRCLHWNVCTGVFALWWIHSVMFTLGCLHCDVYTRVKGVTGWVCSGFFA